MGKPGGASEDDLVVVCSPLLSFWGTVRIRAARRPEGEATLERSSCRCSFFSFHLPFLSHIYTSDTHWVRGFNNTTLVKSRIPKFITFPTASASKPASFFAALKEMVYY